MTDLKTRIENIYALDRERTQGEWCCVPDTVNSPSRIIYAGETHICKEHTAMSTSAESYANAKLIAAAPEMVDIIRSLEAKVAQQQKEHKAAILAIYSLSVGLKDSSGVHAAICEFIETQLEERLNENN